MTKPILNQLYSDPLKMIIQIEASIIQLNLCSVKNLLTQSDNWLS